jgi:hypothetical protein
MTVPVLLWFKENIMFDETYLPLPPTEKEIIEMRLQMIDREYRTPRTLADAARGNAWALSRLAQAEELSEPLRAELGGLI